MAAHDLVAAGLSGELFSLECNEPVAQAIRVMSEHDFSQISVTHDKRLVGSLNEARLYEELVRDPGIKGQPVESIMEPAFPFVDVSTPGGLRRLRRIGLAESTVQTKGVSPPDAVRFACVVTPALPAGSSTV